MKQIFESKKIDIWYSLTHFSIGVNIQYGMIQIILPFLHINITYDESKIPNCGS